MSDIVWGSRPFGLRGNHLTLRKRGDDLVNPVFCVCRNGEKNKISKHLIVRNNDKINEYQVVFPEACGGGKGRRHEILPKDEHLFILKRGRSLQKHI